MKDTTDICDRKTYVPSACVRKEIPRQRFLDSTCSKVIRLRRRTTSDGKFVRTYWLILFLICFAVAFIASGCKKREKPESSVPTVEVALPLVDSVTIYNEYPATIVTESQADVVAKVNGQILSRNFQPGSYVKKGQLLYVIESKTYSAAVGEAKAQLQSAQSQLEYATKHLAALQEAYASDAVSEMEVAQARSARAEAAAAVNSARATLESQSIRLGYCRITAPVSGKITESLLDVGEYVSGEGAPVKLATIYNDADLKVSFTIPENEYASISSKGDGFKAPPFSDMPLIVSASPSGEDGAPVYKAALDYEAPNVESSSGSVTLIARLKSPGEYLRSGMYGKIKLPVSTLPKGILVRDVSLSTDQRGNYLYTLNDSDRIVYTPVKVGDLYQDTLRLVLSGIGPHTRYVTRAMISVRNGEKVMPKLITNPN